MQTKFEQLKFIDRVHRVTISFISRANGRSVGLHRQRCRLSRAQLRALARGGSIFGFVLLFLSLHAVLEAKALSIGLDDLASMN